ncbi:MAG: prepilin-type N-terminal cleavage/methylation domain-containing protein [Oscillospiraceae bacterium]|nr:prepilin-type N-terminal cleavage/methylation domain-containing protein [Oscillospiraceae bacterium]
MKKDRRGFTLAELLLVVGVLAVLVAIVIPLFGTPLERSREATDIANIRSAYYEVVNYYVVEGAVTTIEVPVRQRYEGWATDPPPQLVYAGSRGGPYSYEAKTSGCYFVTVDVDPETGGLIPNVS